MTEVGQLLIGIRATSLREVGILIGLSSAIVLLSRLWTDASHSTNSRTTFTHRLVVSIGGLVVAVLLANRASSLVDVLVWRQVVVMSSTSIICICLVKLVQNRSASFIINITDLSHNLLLKML